MGGENVSSGRRALGQPRTERVGERSRCRSRIAALVGFVAALGLVAGGHRATADDATPHALNLVSEGIGTPRTWVFALAQRGSEIWAVGNFGFSVKRPGSASWADTMPAKGRVPLAVVFAPSGAGVAVGQEGAVWDIEPGSAQWTEGSVGAKDRLFGVAVSSQGAYFAVGGFGAMHVRPAGSKSWQRGPSAWEQFDGPHLYAVSFLDDEAALVVGEHATILTIAHGEIVDQQRLGDESLFALARCGDRLVAAGQEGVVLTSADGKAWEKGRIAPGFDTYGLGCLPDQRMVALGSGVVKLGSPAMGWQTWEPTSTRPGWFSGVLVDQAAVYIAGLGDIWRTQFSSHAE